MASERIERSTAESYGKLFLRFLRFGALAWGGPVAQIAMIRRELVDELRWIPSERFNRVLAVYQVLPGPEAHELCVYFGMQQRGRIGGLLAGLGFMMPGLVLMLLLSWLYVSTGAPIPLVAALFYGAQPAIAAVVIRAAHRLSVSVLSNQWLIAIAVMSAIAHAAGIHFLVFLPAAGITYWMALSRPSAAIAVLALVAVLSVGQIVSASSESVTAALQIDSGGPRVRPTMTSLLASGLKTGSLTFGGAYTAIPFLQSDAVGSGGWMTADQFLDGLAMSGILPAPLVIFGTFVGYVAGDLVGALIVTFGIFLPAFAFTLVGHELMERLISNERLHTILMGITAGVIGMIAVTAFVLALAAVTDVAAFLICVIALLALFASHSRWAIVSVICGGALAGLVAGS